MRSSLTSRKKLAYKQIEQAESLVQKDPFRLHYHIMPPVGLLNDPNGFVYFNGNYHIFYQWNPYETSHGLKYWGHYISSDCVNWKPGQIALTPDQWFDKDGCYSGSAIVHQNQMYVFYTGNVKDEQGNRETYQCLAVSEDGIHFDKKGPIVYLPEGYTGHFRDPKIFKKDNIWYMIIGAQTDELNGEVVLFSSDNLYDWTFIGPIAGSFRNGLESFGYMWECPDLFSINGNDILIVSPQGLKPKGYEFNNIFQSGYFSGKVNLDKLTFSHNKFIELDRGFDFYAPQTMLDHKGRRIMFAWMGNAEEDGTTHPTERYGWIHALTIPRLLKWERGKLIQQPIPELKKLRQKEQVWNDIFIDRSNLKLSKTNHSAYELIFKLHTIEAKRITIGIGRNCLLSFDRTKGVFTLQRNKIMNDQIESRHCFVQSLYKIQVFKDASSIEVFLNDGEEVFSSRIYDNTDHCEITIDTNGKVSMDIDKWQLKSIYS